MTLNEQIAIMQSFHDGVYIDSRPRCMGSQSLWCENDTPGWNWADVEYRIRPVPKITRQKLIDDIVSCSNNADDAELADYHRYVTSSEVTWDQDGFSEK